MVKSVLGVNHQGLTEWIIQRVSAVLMVIYTALLVGFFYTHPNVSFYEWHELFTQLGMKTFTLLVLASLLYHAWIGMWTVFTDYVKPFILALVLHVVTLIALVAFFFEGALILWSV